MPYDRAVVAPPSDQATPAPAAVAIGRAPRHRHAPTAPSAPVLSGGRLTALALVVVVAPFVVAFVRIAVASAPRLTLADDLALIDLHVRRALVWKQQLGVFDHNNWNHPGPAYFYLVSFVYRVLGSGARSLFLAATLLNGLAAAACVVVVRRRTSPSRALWASVWIALLVWVLASGGPGSTTYSESVLGALVSPWNPMVVLFPLLLLALLCAAAVDRSTPSLVGGLLVASYVVQTDISTLPVAVALVGGAGVARIATVVADRRRRVGAGADRVASGRRGPVLVAAGLVLLVVMWLPPLIQQFTNDPGNLTLIARFFTAGHPGQGLSSALWSVAAGTSVLLLGPAEVMTSILGGTPMHAALAVAVGVATPVVAAVTVVVGVRSRRRFTVGVAGLCLLSCLAAVVAVLHAVGYDYGYLVIWAVVLPVLALVGVGTLPTPRAGTVVRRVRPGGPVRRRRRRRRGRVRAGGGRPTARPGRRSAVGRLADLVEPHLVPGGPVAVGDAGAGTAPHRAARHRALHRSGQPVGPLRLPPDGQCVLEGAVRSRLPVGRHRAPGRRPVHVVAGQSAAAARLRGPGGGHGRHRHRPVRERGPDRRLSGQPGDVVEDDAAAGVDAVAARARAAVPRRADSCSSHGDTSLAPAGDHVDAVGEPDVDPVDGLVEVAARVELGAQVGDHHPARRGRRPPDGGARCSGPPGPGRPRARAGRRPARAAGSRAR